jgi:transposase
VGQDDPPLAWVTIPKAPVFSPTEILPVANGFRELAGDPQHAFPGQGQMKPEQAEIARLKKEVAKLRMERDILKKAAAYFAKEST